MILKLGLKIGFLALEIFLAFYSYIVTDSLLVKFVFFVFTAGILAFGVLKTATKLLPSTYDLIPAEQRELNIANKQRETSNDI